MNDQRRIRVLNVNDNLAARYVVTKMLRQGGFDVAEACDGGTCLSVAGSWSPDVIVLDVKLPDVDGFEVCRQLKAGTSTASIKIIHTSATFVTMEKRQRGFDAGADGYLTQPFESQDLTTAVKSLARLRETEVALRDQNSRLQETDRKKDEFLAMLAHELRNPLMVISTAHALYETEHLPEDAQRLADVTGRQVKHLARLVDDLLEASRITRGKVQLRRQRLDLVGLVKQAVGGAKSLLMPRHQLIELQLPEHAVWVDADPLRLEQVLNNLLSNASKYSPANTSIAVAVDCDTAPALGIAVRASGDDLVEGCEGGARLRVRDQGIGLRPEDLERIFEPFVQVDSSKARSLGGLGIGLAMARSLVELHGGRIEARSEGKDQGSEIVVWLPTTDPPGDRPDGAVDGDAGDFNAGSLSVLVVEDNREAATMFAALVRHLGHKVVVVHDGRAGVEAAVSDAYDVAFVDIGLPGLDGFEVAARLRGSGVRTRLIALTGYGRPEDRAHALDVGFDDFAVKPIDAAAVRRFLARVRASSTFAQPSVH